MRPFLRRLGRVVSYGIALLAITACATLFYFRYVQHRRSGETQRLLDQADALAWNNQWLKAEPVYQQAERLFDQKNDSSRALYAHVSQIIPHAESRSLPATILELTDDLKLLAAQDPETRLRVLTIRGMVEVNHDAAMAPTRGLRWLSSPASRDICCLRPGRSARKVSRLSSLEI